MPAWHFSQCAGFPPGDLAAAGSLGVDLAAKARLLLWSVPADCDCLGWGLDCSLFFLNSSFSILSRSSQSFWASISGRTFRTYCTKNSTCCSIVLVEMQAAAYSVIEAKSVTVKPAAEREVLYCLASARY